MAGRNHRVPRQPDNFRNFHDAPHPAMHRGPGPLPIHPAALEEELEIQHRDIQRILSENRHVVDENTILQRELEATKDQIRKLDRVIPNLHADKEAHTKELIERGMKLEAELRASEPLRSEVMHLRAEAKKLSALRDELSGQVQNLTKDISKLKSENQQVNAMKTDIDGMRKELMEARRAYEFEKKANEEQMEQKDAMEKNLISMAREIEKLRAEHLNAERRVHGLGGGGGGGGGGYGMFNGGPDMRYQGSGAFGDAYGGGAWGSYDNRGPPRR